MSSARASCHTERVPVYGFTILPGYILGVQQAAQQALGLTPSVGEINATMTQLENQIDVVFIPGTGSGKTILWMNPVV